MLIAHKFTPVGMLLEIISNYYNLVPNFPQWYILRVFFFSPRKSGPISDDVIGNFMSVLGLGMFFPFRLFNHLLYPEDENCETISKECEQRSKREDPWVEVLWGQPLNMLGCWLLKRPSTPAQLAWTTRRFINLHQKISWGRVSLGHCLLGSDLLLCGPSGTTSTGG